MKIKFKNWDKYNIRQKDIKRPFWFAMSNGIFMDEIFAEFNDQQKISFVYLLAEASRQNKYGEVEVSEVLYSRITGYKYTVLMYVVDKLLKSGRAAECRQDGGKIATATEQDPTVQEKKKSLEETVAVAPPSGVFLGDGNGHLWEELKTRKVNKAVVDRWLKICDPETLGYEINKAITWELANPKKIKKNFSAFFTNWLNRVVEEKKHSKKYIVGDLPKEY